VIVYDVKEDRIMSLLTFLLADNNSPASPIYEAITLIGPYALGVISLLVMIYGIVLGVKFAKAEDKETRKKLQQTLINFIIGALSIYVLIGILYAIRPYV